MLRVNRCNINVTPRKEYFGTILPIHWLLQFFSLYVHNVIWVYDTWFWLHIFDLEWTLHSNIISTFCSIVVPCKSFICCKNKFYSMRRSVALFCEQMYIEDREVENYILGSMTTLSWVIGYLYNNSHEYSSTEWDLCPIRPLLAVVTYEYHSCTVKHIL